MRAGLVAIALLATAIACTQRDSAVHVSSSAPASPAGECGHCHAAETAEWNSSLHHSAFTDKDFQASFAVEPEKFCYDCHAPLSAGRGDTVGEAKGIGCPSCHTSATGHGAPKTDCAGCHEFTFPKRSDLMQSTIREHAESSFKDTACTACHMPKASDGHRSHRFDVSRNEELLKRALAMSATRTKDGIEIELTPKNVGHRLPTGDLFRRILVVVRAESADGMPLGEEEIVVGRRFAHGSFAKEISDTRLTGPRTMPVKGEWLTSAARITIEARYERVAQTTEVRNARGGLTRQDSVFAGIVLAVTTLDR